MNIYLIASESVKLINDEVKKLTKDKEVLYFDLNNMPLEDVLVEANYTSLFGDKKTIVVKNSSIFSADAKTKEEDQENLIKYLENPNEDTMLIFVYNGKVDTRKKITKMIKEKYKLTFIEKYKYADLVDKVRELFKQDKYIIDNEGINYIINACLNNYDLICNEIEKIKVYYNKSCKVELSDIKNIVSKSIEDNNFKFIESVIDKDIKKINKYLNELAILKVEPISLINLLAREYRLMHMIKTLYEDNKSLSYISKELKLQDWQTDKILKNSFNYTIEDIENNLIIINECDLNLKSVYFDKYAMLKSYILKMIL